jgi:hypothetical protein
MILVVIRTQHEVLSILFDMRLQADVGRKPAAVRFMAHKETDLTPVSPRTDTGFPKETDLTPVS